MSTRVEKALTDLQAVLTDMSPVAVAVSGGVDSMTLAFIAGQLLGDKVSMLHAVSPAVPPEATDRVRAYAERYAWPLDIMDAGEFSDERYMANPVNRCFFCKTNLYATMSERTQSTLVSGTNTDDLGDYRPGLKAADDHRVLHPYVVANIDKAMVRQLASAFQLTDLAELPAAPCLSSRIETGIVIDPAVLQAVNQVEKELRATLAPQTARCRVRNNGVEVQLDSATLQKTGLMAEGESRREWQQRVSSIFATLAPSSANAPVTFSEYRMGSAFLTKVT